MSVTGRKTESVAAKRPAIVERCQPMAACDRKDMSCWHTCLFMKRCGSDSILSQQLKVSWHFVLAGKSSYVKINSREKWNINERRRRCKNEHVRRDKSDLPLPGLSAWTALSVYSAYFPKGTLTKKSAALSSLNRAISVASCLGNIVYAPIYTREELFSLCYLQHSRAV